jgi:ATP-dependent Clp protease ATP-binding subunit ClpA
MFERYTERARRVLFFARYEASQLGSFSIETEHLLLGLIREGKGLTSRIFARLSVSLESIRIDIEARTVVHDKKISTSVEIPFTAETKRTLQFACEEADRLMHSYIGTEHLLLGILREERCLAAKILMEQGLRLDTARAEIVNLLNEKDAPAPASELTRCCFCGGVLPPHDAAALVLFARPDRESSQTLYAHRLCLRTRVMPGVTLITDDDDDEYLFGSADEPG